MLSINDTEHAIKLIKDTFETLLSSSLHLCRVTAPLFIKSNQGLNDTLNFNEQPIKFWVPAIGSDCEIVQSLAKWKRMKLYEMSEIAGFGIYTDMNAIRPNETLDELHSLYVDQWDWEKVLTENQFNNGGITSMSHAMQIYSAIKNTDYVLREHYKELGRSFLPDGLQPITSDILAARYPKLTPAEREYEYCKEHKAIFIMKIGGKNHDGLRAPDYDDWEKNGDILIWSPILNRPIEISSMGVRVNGESLHKQLEESGHLDWEEYDYHKKILNNELPLTIGGGIGQSRLCMLLLQKRHIGEVQVSVWPDKEIEKYQDQNANASIMHTKNYVNIL